MQGSLLNQLLLFLRPVNMMFCYPLSNGVKLRFFRIWLIKVPNLLTKLVVLSYKIIPQMGNATSGKSRGGTLATTLSIGQTKAHRVVTKLSLSSLSPLFLSPSE